MPARFRPSQYLGQPLDLNAGPIVGCRDSATPTTAAPGYARFLGNLYRAPGPIGSAQIGRPGFTAMGTASGTLVQALFTWTLPVGVRLTLRVVDGQVSVYDWITNSWALAVTQANFATAGGAFSATARVALVPFADKLVISDQTNKAFWWDGTTGSGGLTRLVNAPVMLGVPTVYYSKLFCFNGQDLFWSESGDATVGYDARNYVWTNPGGYASPMTAIVGTNEALYVFRSRVSLAITGKVNSAFATDGTTANLSADIGTESPFATFAITQGVFTVDADANPWVFHYGLPAPRNLSDDCLVTTQRTPRASMANALGVYDEATASVLLGLPGIGHVYATQWLCYQADTLQYNGVWTWGVEAFACGLVIDDNGVKRWAHGDVTGGAVSVHGTPVAGPWDDTVQGTDVAIRHQVIGPYLGWDPRRELLLHTLTASFGMRSVRVGLSYETSRGRGTMQYVPVGTPGTDFVLDVSRLDVGRLARAIVSAPRTVGIAGRGRWAALIIDHAVAGERFAHDVHQFEATIMQGNPRQP